VIHVNLVGTVVLQMSSIFRRHPGCIVNHHNRDVHLFAVDLQAQLVFKSPVSSSEGIGTHLGLEVNTEVIGTLKSCFVENGDGSTAARAGTLGLSGAGI